MPKLSYSLQLAEHDHDQVDERGEASPEAILAAFDAFDWTGQVQRANEIEKCSPTFSVRDTERDALFWVSGYGEPSAPTFVTDLSYRGTKKRLFGLLSSEGIISPRTRTLSLAEARQGVALFVAGQINEVARLVAAA